MLTKVHPEENGIRFEQDVLDFHGWILEEIQDGRLRLVRKLDIAATVHDNCYAKVGGDQYFEQAPRLLDLAGVGVEQHPLEQAASPGSRHRLALSERQSALRPRGAGLP